MRRKIILAVLFVFFVLYLSKTINTPLFRLKKVPTPSDTLSFSTSRVIRVVDGDTIELENRQKVRYIGIDTPEVKDPRKPVQCFGEKASEKNKELVEGRVVRLEKDVSETDRFGRLLRYVYVGDVFVNDYLVRNGYAHSATFPPDITYQEQFRQAEEEARSKKRGLWDAC